ncbi:hypothetical protein [Streptoalloteichus hindustanus]|uniref:DUF4352 domain-containing protein n=1 Tax=Streptoalloteichus hindustanus TaxID=2017 RepID=A0A1M5H5P1_STRHI|nr:hypothetical protein [Streptoalloteichus hindustanus]SHG11274.1 hypothetical protein SAMN05444320_106413 [Streptoalloteichus hindustanus]
MTAPQPSDHFDNAPPPVLLEPLAEADQRRNGLGTAALVVGASGILLAALVVTGPVGALLGVAGVVLGVLGLRRVRGGQADNRTASVAGVVVSVVALGVGAATSVLLVQSVREHSEPKTVAAPTAPPPTGPPITPQSTPDRVKEKPVEIPTVAPGTPVTVHERRAEYVVTVSDIRPNVPAPNQFDRPTDGGVFLTAQVEFAVSEAADPIPVFASATRFKFVYADGTTNNTAHAGFSIPGRKLDTLTLAAGQKTNGMIVFEVDPNRLAGARIQVDDRGGAPAGYWTVG